MPEFRFCRCGYTQAGLALEAAKCEADSEADAILKKFKKPVGMAWQDRGYSYNNGELSEWLASGGNYGIIAGSSWIIDGKPVRLFILDADSVKAWTDAGFFDDLPKRTLTVQSSTADKRHFYFLTDLVSSKAHEELPGLGHFKFKSSQCVGPGSLHPSGVRYSVIDYSAPAYVDAETLTKAIVKATEALQPAKLPVVQDMLAVKSGHASHLAENLQRLEDRARQAKAEQIKRVRAEERGEILESGVKAEQSSDVIALIAIINADERINPCIRSLNAGLPEKHRFEAMTGVTGKPGEGEHHVRLAWATALIKSGYTDAEIQLLAACFDDYVKSRTQEQLDSVRRWVKDEAGNYYPCRSLQEYIPSDMCAGCRWHPPGADVEAILEDNGAPVTLPEGVRRWTDDLPPGVPGVDGDGIAYVKVKRDTKDGESKFVKTAVCDGYAFIAEETRDRITGEASFTIQGYGSRDRHVFKFDITGREFADPRKLRAALVAHFGARNLVKGLDGEAIQLLTEVVRKLTLIDRPIWIDGRLAIPGVDDDGFKFRINERIPVDLTSGEVEPGLRALGMIFQVWPAENTSVMVAAALGSPLAARWFPGDRFALAMVGTTGRGLKTEALKMLMAFYGQGFLEDKSLLRWGEGATNNAMLTIAASSGCLPTGIDNYKPTQKDGPSKFVSVVHTVLEGRDRERLTRNTELRDTREYGTTLIVTGEDLPEEASTLARMIPIEWTAPPDLDRLTELQAIASNLPAVGRMWCKYLAGPDVKIDLAAWASSRQALVTVAKDAESINPGRIGTTASILKLVWKTALDSPIGEVLKPHTEAFEKGLAKLIRDAATATRESTEAAQFIETLRELVTSGRCIVVDRTYSMDISTPNVIGWRLRDPDPDAGCIAILPTLAIDAVRRVTGQQGQAVGAKALYRQLDEMGVIVSDGGRRALKKRVGSKTLRVLVFKPGVLMDEDGLMEEVDLTKATEYAAEDTQRRQALQALDESLRRVVKIE